MLSSAQPLTATHVPAGFDSGVPSLDDWLRRRALQSQLTGASRSFVLCDPGETVVAYYALVASAVAVDATPDRFRRNMPHPIPVVVLARLAGDRKQRGSGLGRGLYWDAALKNRSSNQPRSCLPQLPRGIHQKKTTTLSIADVRAFLGDGL